MSRATIENALYVWIASVATPLSANSLFADQDYPRAGKVFVTIRIGTQTAVGLQDDRTNPSAGGIATIMGERRMTIHLEAYGAGAFDLMDAIHGSLNKEAVRNSLYFTGGIAVMRTEGILNLTQLVDTNFEPRFAMDMIIGYKRIDTEDVSWIQTVEIEGELDTPTATKTIGPFTVTLT